MDVRSSFSYRPRNVSGEIQNPVVVLDEAANTPQVVTAATNMNAVDMANYSDNYLQITFTLEDADGVSSTGVVFMLPGSSESWSFEGRFITGASIVIVDKPTATVQDASLLSVSTTGMQPGIVDVNLIET